MRAKAISFDADGTLFGTFTHCRNGFETFFLEAARSRGRNFSRESLLPILEKVKKEESLRRSRGFQPYVSQANIRAHWLWFYEEVFKGMHLPEVGKMACEFMERYESGEFTALYPDTMACLESLKAGNIPMILISNFSPHLNRFLEKLGIACYFKAVLVSGVEGLEKPDQALYQKGASVLSLEPREILHVGNDLYEDYEGASKAGFQTVLLDRENSCMDKTILRIASLSELPGFLAEGKT